MLSNLGMEDAGAISKSFRCSLHETMKHLAEMLEPRREAEIISEIENLDIMLGNNNSEEKKVSLATQSEDQKNLLILP